MSNVQRRRLPLPNTLDTREVIELKRRIARGELKPARERLAEQLEAILAKWNRILGDDNGPDQVP
jgi:hypothetical protein